MKYIQAVGVEEGERYYFETDGQGTAYRQITVFDGNRYRVSAAPDFFLTDQEVEMMEGDCEIPKEQFERLWLQATEPYRADWQRVKRQYSPGDFVSGVIAMFYPHGTIIRLSGEQAYAVTGDAGLRERTPPQYLYPGYRIEGVVAGYDEEHLWLVLEGCVITGENV
ncbi:hypothetical protein N0M98_18710 [Paenibacillus doosanensis]|uniref:S1 motif domain-containing protein n=1 Tax=Paenibacillus konkukensis TaxID=2020716 RepID=A0ABY4RND6_9BACL|nr:MULTISPECIES: hypothetical protein [Paenibacillus]MCS7462174.1 hypothetical protein [Paenibacillus doosanensis]UQZ82964.1 hypothetical protein SK3146_02124 [Paenibacillus konkukensis]